MSFNVLYIEDDPDYSQRVQKAVDVRAGEPQLIKMHVIQAPEKLQEELDKNYNLILADVFFPDQALGERDRLDDIIRITQEWSKANQLERSVPIIAYTGREKGALDNCLERRDALYDIWDKASASPAYAAWRLTRICVEMSRSNPDALLHVRV